MKKVLAVLVLAIMTTGCAQAQNYGYNRGYAKPGYNQGYNNYRANNNGYNYAGAAIVGAVIGAVTAGVISQSFAQPMPQPVCYQVPATTYVPSQWNINQMVPITTMNTVCR
jgi:hypothetical protein